jgi:hypothetical protein
MKRPPTEAASQSDKCHNDSKNIAQPIKSVPSANVARLANSDSMNMTLTPTQKPRPVGKSTSGLRLLLRRKTRQPPSLLGWRVGRSLALIDTLSGPCGSLSGRAHPHRVMESTTGTWNRFRSKGATPIFKRDQWLRRGSERGQYPPCQKEHIAN